MGGHFRVFGFQLFLAEPLQCGIPLGTGWPGAASRPIPQQYSVFPLFTSRTSRSTLFSEQILSSAALFWTLSTIANPHRDEKQPGWSRGLRGPAAAARDGHPGLEQPILVWKCTVVQCYRCNFDLQCWHVSGSCVWLVFSVSGRLQNFGPTHWKNKKPT